MSPSALFCHLRIFSKDQIFPDALQAMKDMSSVSHFENVTLIDFDILLTLFQILWGEKKYIYNFYVLGPAFGSWGNTKPCCCIVDTLHCGVAVWMQARWCDQSWGWRSFPGLLKCEMCHITYPQADNGPGSVLLLAQM